jgi:hypothetical protein
MDECAGFNQDARVDDYREQARSYSCFRRYSE